jgi:hypothetical protein
LQIVYAWLIYDYDEIIFKDLFEEEKFPKTRNPYITAYVARRKIARLTLGKNTKIRKKFESDSKKGALLTAAVIV